MALTEVLRTERLSKEFDGFEALDGVDFSLDEGEVRGVIGPNGAGKTTFFDLLSGTVSPTSGRVYLRGEDVTRLAPHDIARRGLVRVFQIENVFPALTVAENVLGALNARRGVTLGKYDEHDDAVLGVLRRVGIEEYADERASDLSHGDQRRLETALALATEPDVLLLDEPTAGLSADETDAFVSLVDALADEMSVVVVEHDMDVVMDLVDSVTVLHDGRVLAEGTPDEIRRDDEVERVYFGRGTDA